MNIQAIKQYNLEKQNLVKYNVQNAKVANIPAEENDTLSFKGVNPSGDWVSRFFGEHYAKPLYDNKKIHNLSKRLANMSGSMTEHMATLGSLITSSVYMTRTLKNKDLDPEKRRTLSINQLLCFIIPTVCAYFVNYKIAGKTKALERRYAGLINQKKALGEIPADKIADLEKNFGNKMKGFKTLASLSTFTLIYRYITPVAITPGANWIGDKVNSSKKRNKFIQDFLKI